jgi:hypothetical protein
VVTSTGADRRAEGIPVEAGTVRGDDVMAGSAHTSVCGVNTSNGDDVFYDVNRQPIAISRYGAAPPRCALRRIFQRPAANHGHVMTASR